jgi:Asp-tRNA(Asn)/Glu-tRNA(Gln) amidotransferase A subunit family amidase
MVGGHLLVKMKDRLLLSAAAIALLTTAGFAWRSASAQRQKVEAQKNKTERKRGQVVSSASQVLAEASVDEEVQEFIWRATMSQLKQALAAKQVTAEQIVLSLARRVRGVGLTMNAVAGVSLQEALASARLFDQGHSQEGMLAGLPLCVDESFQQANFSCSFGLVDRAYSSQESDGLIIQVLKAQGVIPLVRSTGSEGGTALETVSPLWGRCRNPWKIGKAMPGTAGGAGVLVATGCVPIALVSDFGGGASVSALNSGVFSLMPTPSRGTVRGLLNPLDDRSESWFINMKQSVGAIARSVDDIALLLTGLWATSADKAVPHVPFDDSTYTAEHRLKIGIVSGNFGFELPGVTSRVLAKVKAMLDPSSEVKIVSVDWLVKVQDVFNNWVSSGGYAESLGETPAKSKGLFASIWRAFAAKERSVGRVVRDTTEIDAYAFFTRHRLQLDILRDEVRDLLLEHDAVILPSFMCPAWPELHGGEMQDLQASSLLGSLYGLPSGTAPLTTVKVDEQAFSTDKLNAKGLRGSLEGSLGLPVGVVVLSRPFHDEVVLRVMKALESNLELSLPLA